MSLPNNIPTPQETTLANALRAKQIEVIQQYFDGHKHIDIYIPKAKLNIEVDGMHHFTSPDQIMRDFNREYYSDISGHHTIHVQNNAIESQYFSQIVSALVEVVSKLARE